MHGEQSSKVSILVIKYMSQRSRAGVAQYTTAILTGERMFSSHTTAYSLTLQQV